MTRCANCHEVVEPRVEHRPHGQIVSVLNVDERGWCETCCWLEAADRCERCNAPANGGWRGLCDAHEEQALDDGPFEKAMDELWEERG